MKPTLTFTAKKKEIIDKVKPELLVSKKKVELAPKPDGSGNPRPVTGKYA